MIDLTNNPSLTVALGSILEERERQLAKWGEQNHDPFCYLTVLGEEYGETCEAALHSRFGGPKAGNLRAEAVQVAAVGLAIVECLDRGKWSWVKGGEKTRKLEWEHGHLAGEFIGSLEGQPEVSLFLIQPAAQAGHYMLKGAFVPDQDERDITYTSVASAQVAADRYLEAWFVRNS